MKKRILAGVAAALVASGASAVQNTDTVRIPAVLDDGPVQFANEIDVTGGVVFGNSQITPITAPNQSLLTSGNTFGNLTVLVPAVIGVGNGENTFIRLNLSGDGASAPQLVDLSQQNIVTYGFNVGADDTDANNIVDQRPEGALATRQCRATVATIVDTSTYIIDVNCEEAVNIKDFIAIPFNVLLDEKQNVFANVSRHDTRNQAVANTDAFFTAQEQLLTFVDSVSVQVDKLSPVDFINPGDENGTDPAQDPLAGVRNSFMFGGTAAGGNDEADDNAAISNNVTFAIQRGVLWNTSEELAQEPGYVLNRATFDLDGDFTNITVEGVNIDNNGFNPMGVSLPALAVSVNSAYFEVPVDTADGLAPGDADTISPLSFELNAEGLGALPGFTGPINPSAFHVDTQLSPVDNSAISAGLSDGNLDADPANDAVDNAQTAADSLLVDFDSAYLSDLELGGAVDQANFIWNATNLNGADASAAQFSSFIRITNDTNCPAEIHVRMIDDAGESSYFLLSDVANGAGTPFPGVLDSHASTSTINANRFYEAAAAAAAEHGYGFDIATKKARLEIVSTYSQEVQDAGETVRSAEHRPNSAQGTGTSNHNGGGSVDQFGLAIDNTEGFPAVDVQVLLRAIGDQVITFTDTQD